MPPIWSRLKRWNNTISSSRLRNSGRNRGANLLHDLIARGVDIDTVASAARVSLPKFEVSTIKVS